MALIKCKECDKKINDKADSCINCGTPIIKEDKKICPECKSKVNDVICKNCGYDFSRETKSNKNNRLSFFKFSFSIFVVLIVICLNIRIWFPHFSIFNTTFINRSSGATITLNGFFGGNNGKFVALEQTLNFTYERYKEGGHNKIDIKFEHEEVWTCYEFRDYIKCGGYSFDKK